MPVIRVSSRKELFVKQLVFWLKSISLKDREEVYRLPDGQEITASVRMFERFRILQRMLWVYCFPVVLVHEFSHGIVELLLNPSGRNRATWKKRIKIFLAILAGPLSDVIVCLSGILCNLWIPLKVYLISSSIIPLVIWTTEDFRGLLMILRLWKPLIIFYGFSTSKEKWYTELFDRYRNQRVFRRYESDERNILQEVEKLKRLSRTNLVERKDIQ